jgi:hypothetical protein
MSSPDNVMKKRKSKQSSDYSAMMDKLEKTPAGYQLIVPDKQQV